MKRICLGVLGLWLALIIVAVEAETKGRIPPHVTRAETAVFFTTASPPFTAETDSWPGELIAFNKQAPLSAPPEAVLTYRLSLDNLDAVTHTFTLTDVIPAGIEYIPGSATGGLVYDAVAGQVTWQGAVAPGVRGYRVTEAAPLAYVNLGDLGAPNLCQQVMDCDDGGFLFDLSDVNGMSYTYTFYDESLTEIVVSANGILFGPEGMTNLACTACPQPLPHLIELNQVMAGLWRDIDTSGGVGQWYAGVLGGLLPNPADRVFYANWHNAGQFGDPFITSRHAIAVVLDGQSEPAGRLYFIYDDVPQTAVLQPFGYAIGVENETGDEGVTYAFAPCPYQPCVSGSIQGTLPANGTILQLEPAIVGGSSARQFTYQGKITAAAGQVITNTAVVMSDGPQQFASTTAVTQVQYRATLPLIFR